MRFNLNSLILLSLFSSIIALVFLYISTSICSFPYEKAPQKVDVIFCLSGTNERLEKTVVLLQHGYADNVIMTTQSAYLLIRNKIPDKNSINIFKGTAQNTYEEAELLRSITNQQGFQSVLVVSNFWHLYRVKWVLGKVFENKSVAFTYIAADNFKLSQNGWWVEKASRVVVISEVSKFVYYWVRYGLFR